MSQILTLREDYFWAVFGLPREGIDFVAFLLVVLHAVLVVVLAVAVWIDGRKKVRNGGSLFLISAWTWSLIVLATGGYAGALVYWLIHYSSLRYRREENG